jgi:hypothetical protein
MPTKRRRFTKRRYRTRKRRSRTINMIGCKKRGCRHMRGGDCSLTQCGLQMPATGGGNHLGISYDVGHNPAWQATENTGYASVGGKKIKGKKMKGGFSLLPQDLVNVGRGVMYSGQTFLNRFNGYGDIPSPLPYQDQLRTASIAPL